MPIVEVNFRGVIQKKVASNLINMIYQANVKAGRAGMTFLRWNDSPERVGIPAKIFAVTEKSLEEIEGTSIYEPATKDVSVALDDAMLFGLESAGSLGIESVVDGMTDKGLLVIVTEQEEGTIRKYLPRTENRYEYALVRGKAPFAGMWKPLEPSEMSHLKVLGAIARYSPKVVSYEEAKGVIPKEGMDAFKDGYEHSIHGELIEKGAPPKKPKWPSWKELPRISNVIPAVEISGRNPHYSKGTTKTDFPLIDKTKCTKCSLCWISCPEGCLNRKPDGYYQVEEEYCSGCGMCAEVCAPKAIRMINLIDYKEGKVKGG
jgi:2-oxoacid:acceptor oxidoreductase delta subunit (pyruvate/2-ketoisovalerate family)